MLFLLILLTFPNAFILKVRLCVLYKPISSALVLITPWFFLPKGNVEPTKVQEVLEADLSRMRTMVGLFLRQKDLNFLLLVISCLF